LRQEVTGLGLEYRLLTQFTSFVAVEETIITDGGKPRRIDVPVETPEGTTTQAVDGDEEFNVVTITGKASSRIQTRNSLALVGPVVKSSRARRGAGSVGGSGSGSSGAVLAEVFVEPPPPPSPSPAPTPMPTAAVSGGVMGGRTESKPPPDPAKEKWKQFLVKLSPEVASLVERLREGKETPGAAEAAFVRDGKAELRIWLTEKSPAVRAQLKKQGFELILEAPSGGLVIGRMPVEKVAALADIPAVRYVAPQLN
jgi:Ca-activated chloride channel family protein